MQLLSDYTIMAFRVPLEESTLILLGEHTRGVMPRPSAKVPKQEAHIKVKKKITLLIIHTQTETT